MRKPNRFWDIMMAVVFLIWVVAASVLAYNGNRLSIYICFMGFCASMVTLCMPDLLAEIEVYKTKTLTHKIKIKGTCVGFETLEYRSLNSEVYTFEYQPIWEYEYNGTKYIYKQEKAYFKHERPEIDEEYDLYLKDGEPEHCYYNDGTLGKLIIVMSVLAGVIFLMLWMTLRTFVF